MRQMVQQQEQQSEGHEVETALKDAEGKVLIKTIGDLLIKRINAMIDSDPESKAYVKIVKGLGSKIAFGRMAAEQILKRELKEVM